MEVQHISSVRIIKDRFMIVEWNGVSGVRIIAHGLPASIEMGGTDALEHSMFRVTRDSYGTVFYERTNYSDRTTGYTKYALCGVIPSSEGNIVVYGDVEHGIKGGDPLCVTMLRSNKISCVTYIKRSQREPVRLKDGTMMDKGKLFRIWKAGLGFGYGSEAFSFSVNDMKDFCVSVSVGKDDLYVSSDGVFYDNDDYYDNLSRHQCGERKRLDDEKQRRYTELCRSRLKVCLGSAYGVYK